MESTKKKGHSAKSGDDRAKSNATEKKLKILIYYKKKQFRFLEPIMRR